MSKKIGVSRELRIGSYLAEKHNEQRHIDAAHALLKAAARPEQQKCQCSMSISILGDGCRYCQPQEYIDRLHDQIAVDAADYDALKEERDRLKETFKKMRNVAAGYSNYCEQDSASVRRLEKEFDAADDLYLSICALSTVSDSAGEGE